LQQYIRSFAFSSLDANEVMGGVTEVLAYGTAVQVEPIR
jgi:hypothetical protein